MTDIETLGYELVYKAAESQPLVQTRTDVRCQLRALVGMQKEALVRNSATGLEWRLVCDEGPYLNGTDLAPSPLAFYTTGMALSFSSELLKHARAAGVTLNSYRLIQDNFYTMQGSALRGDMIGGVLPAQMTVEIVADAPDTTIAELVAKAEQTSPAQRYMNNVMQNSFGLVHNGEATAAGDVLPSTHSSPAEPTPNLEMARPFSADSYEREIIKKINAAETLFGVEGGAGSSLQATQKRTLHLRGIVTLRDDGLMESSVQLFKPLGGIFRFIGDDNGTGRAPSSLDYLSAGVGFCFMTQIGRFAHIVKQDLKAYSVVQDTSFEIGGDSSVAHPVDTHTFLEMGEAAEAAQKNLWMSERTCFLHAAMRNSTKTEITLKQT